MAFCGNEIFTLATGIWQDLGSPTAISAVYISGWLVQSGNLGSLNNKLSTCFYFSGDSQCIVPYFAGEEASIYSLVYKVNYYNQQVQASVGPAGAWTRLTEGDSTIVRTDISKTYLQLLNTNLAQLRLEIGDWKRAHSIPRVVDAASLYTFPST